MLGTIPKSLSNDTLDMSSVDSMSLDEHIEIKIPEARARENRLMAQNNFVQNINEKSRNASHTHLAVENGLEVFPRSQGERGQEGKEGHNGHGGHNGHSGQNGNMHRSHSHASMKRSHGLTPNGIGHAGIGHDHKDDHSRLKK